MLDLNGLLHNLVQEKSPSKPKRVQDVGEAEERDGGKKGLGELHQLLERMLVPFVAVFAVNIGVIEHGYHECEHKEEYSGPNDFGSGGLVKAKPG